MKCYGRAALSNFLGDRIVYRNLNAVDERLSRLKEICGSLGISNGAVPRKTSLDYARVIIYLLKEAQRIDKGHEALERILYIGDTLMNDGTAFRNICLVGNWQGAAFITSENQELTKLEMKKDQQSIIFINNHWVNLRVFRTLAQIKGIEMDERTAVLIDVDKTALGARGRNDVVIDNARISAAQSTLQEILGNGLNVEEFRSVYEVLNKPAYHTFTADNQDYLVYICMILGCGLFKLNEIQKAAQAGTLSTFDIFLDQVTQRSGELPEKVRDVHQEVCELVKAGDATPFKQFRQAEYLATVASMGQLAEDSSVEELLRDEIVITREVQEFAETSTAAGALVFGLSDKPDEATVLVSSTSKPLHKVQTHVVGGKDERA
ncbi:MAG: hypothetical protein AB2L18_08065 [Anaerolineaceae bacterium]